MIPKTKKQSPPLIKDWGERGLLRTILPVLNRSNCSRYVVGPGDDAAVMRRPVGAVLSIDGLTEGTHFKLSWEKLVQRKGHFSLGRALGWKLLGSSLSDLAAMGETKDRWAMIFVGLPSQLPTQFLLDFFKGVNEMSRRYQCAVVGGDTVRSKVLTLVSAVGGTLVKKSPLRRDGAKPGDLICVAGDVGDSAHGLQILLGKKHLRSPKDEAFFIRKFFEHQPRMKESRTLSGLTGVTCLIDLSDSLQESLELILAKNKLGCEVEIDAIPTSQIYRRLFGVQPSLLTGGEDYALLFTLRNEKLNQLKRKMSFSVIGRVLSKGAGVHTTLHGERFSPPRYFQHFH